MPPLLSEKSLVAEIKSCFEKRKAGKPSVVMIEVRSGLDAAADWSFAAAPAKVVVARSSLEIREHLADVKEDEPLAILTDVEHPGEDVLARVLGHRVVIPNAWDVVAGLFKAQPDRVDPSLRRSKGLASLLIETMPESGYAAVPSGILTAERVLGEVCRTSLHLDDRRPDLGSMLFWTVKVEDASQRFCALGDDVRDVVTRWLVDAAGAAAEPILHLVRTDRADHALPLGLVADVLWENGDEPTSRNIIEGQALFAREIDGERPSLTVARAWVEGSKSALAKLEEPAATDARRLADRILSDWRIGELAGRSQVLDAGFKARLTEFSQAAVAALAGKDGDDLSTVDAAREGIRHHEAAGAPEHVQRLRAVDSAARVVRFLRPSLAEDRPSLRSVSARYSTDLSLVVRLRRDLLRVIDDEVLGPLAKRLVADVGDRIEDEAQTFGPLLASWMTSGSATEHLIGIENVLDRVVVPLAAKERVLLLVLDGLSWATLHELSDTIATEQRFAPVRPAEADWPIVVGALPTITAVCRTSLFCGRLVVGDSRIEAREFAAHPGLLEVSKRGRPPVVFHKSSLTRNEGGAIDQDVETALLDEKQSVVAVVLNAIDDQLSKGEQLDADWNVSKIVGLADVFDRARRSGRVVIVTSDHGHVHETFVRDVAAAADDARFRSGDEPTKGAIVLRGPRVLQVGGVITAMLSERTRFRTHRQAGYHGGASPAEILIPLAVFRHQEQKPTTSHPFAPAMRPAWHDDFTPQPASTRAEELVAADYLPMDGIDPWIDDVMNSKAMKSQRTRLRGVIPDEAKTRRALESLATRGGTMTLDAFAAAIECPGFRAPNIVAGLARLLNLDGSPCLTLDHASETVRLNIPLLQQQFAKGAR